MKEQVIINYVIPVLTLIMIVFVVIGTGYILRSILLWTEIWKLEQEERLVRYVRSKFDLKWPAYFIVSFILGAIVAYLSDNWLIFKLNIIFILLFIFLLWGNLNTLKLRKKILESLRRSGKSASLY